MVAVCAGWSLSGAWCNSRYRACAQACSRLLSLVFGVWCPGSGIGRVARSRSGCGRIRFSKREREREDERGRDEEQAKSAFGWWAEPGEEALEDSQNGRELLLTALCEGWVNGWLRVFSR